MNEIIAKLRGDLFRLKCKLFKKNVYIGDGLKIYKKLRIVGKGKVYIEINCVIGGIRGDDSKYVTIDTHSPNAQIQIGKNVGLFATRISSKYQINIGNDVLIEESGLLDTDFHAIDRNRGAPKNETKEKCQILIGNNVCIGANSIVTKGVTIEDNVIVVPGSVVSMPVKSGSIVAGNPARQVKS